ncbi:uncharacterized protein LOC115211776 isoform X1 [Argonauta hians]
MWNYLFIIQIAGILAGVVNGKATNMCRGNNPKCDKGKTIKIEAVTCPDPVNQRLWQQTRSQIHKQCANIKECALDLIIDPVAACCGTDGRVKKPRLRFVYTCPLMSENVAQNTTTSIKTQNLPKVTTTLKTIHKSTPQHESAGQDIFNPNREGFPESGICEADICQEKPYCSIGSTISILNYTNNGEQNWRIMGMLGYFCNKNQACSSKFGAYTEKICIPGEKNMIQYICMKEKYTSDVDCQLSQVISGSEGHIISIDYPNMIPPESSKCNFRIAFSEAVPVEIFVLDGKNIRMTVIDKYNNAHHTELNQFHSILEESYDIKFEIMPDMLVEKRFWIYYRILPTDDIHSTLALPWNDMCPETIDKKTSTEIHTTESIPFHSETFNEELAKGEVSKQGLPTTHKSVTERKTAEMMKTTLKTVPAVIPDHTEDKVHKAHKPDMEEKTEVESSSTEVNDPEVIGGRPGKTQDVMHTNAASDPRIFGKEVITGLIAGIVILACLVIILLTALIASMKRRRRCLAANAEREECSNNGTINEPLASFQYLKENFGEGDNGTLNGRSKNSESNILGDNSKNHSNSSSLLNKSSLIPAGNESGNKMDSVTSKEDNVFHLSKTGDDFPESDYSTHDNLYPDMGTMKIGDNSFIGRKNSDADILTRKNSQGSKGDDDVFRDLQHFYVNGDDYALVKKESRTSKSSLAGDNSGIYNTSSQVPKSNSGGSVHDSDVLEWTKGFNLAV